MKKPPGGASNPMKAIPVECVKKRDGKLEAMDVGKVQKRLFKLAAGLEINTAELARNVIARIYDGVETERLDDLAAQICSSRIADHPHWNALASRILVDNHHKKTSPSFSETVETLHAHTDVHGLPCPLVSQALYDVTMKHKTKLNKYIDYKRDNLLDYFGMATLLNGSYLMRVNGKVVERPAHMFMRVALGIHGEDIKAALETYDLMSTKRMIHASPTLFSSGTPTPQLSSCFVAGTPVYTLNAGVKAIQDVALGDLVITHLGNVKPVVQKHLNPRRDRALLELRVDSTPTITATEDHAFWSLAAEEARPRWIRLGDLRPGDFIQIPAFAGGEGFRAASGSGLWDVDDDFCQLLGVWYASGFVQDDVIRFTVHNDTPSGVALLQFVVETGKRVFDVAPVVTQKYGRAVSVVFRNAAAAKAFGEQHGVSSRFKSKRLSPDAHNWNATLVESLIAGMERSNHLYGGGHPAFMRDVYALARSRGIPVLYSEDTTVAHVTLPAWWHAGSHAHAPSADADRVRRVVHRVIDGCVFLRVEGVSASTRVDETVYTLGVQDDHSYAVDGLVCQNCFVAGTPVYTVNAGVKAIEDVVVGDLVVTHKARVRPVAQTHANELGDRVLYDFNVYRSPTITATDNHQFMSVTQEQLAWGQEPQWNALGVLRVGDYVEIPRFEPPSLPPVVVGFDCAALAPMDRAFARKWKVDEPFATLLGEWLAHGADDTPEGIGFLLDGETSNDKSAFLIAAARNAFNWPAMQARVALFGIGRTGLVLESDMAMRCMRAIFGKQGNLRLPPEAHAWPTPIVRALLLGFGAVNLSRLSLEVKAGIGEVKEAALHADVFNLVRSRGIVHHDKWSQGVQTIAGRTFLRIEAKAPVSAARARANGTVYTLGVEDDHSYAVDGIISLNCFLVSSKGDSIDSIFSTIKEMALISKYAGGIGVHVSDIRAKGSKIRGTNGIADGIVPMLRLFNDTALYVNQGGGKRPGAIAVYLEPWHADVLSFIQLRKTTGDMKQRCLDLFLALWCPSLLVRRVEADAAWSLMCPDECPGLADVWGAEFDALYERYEREGRAKSSMPARELWKAICLAQAETGVPYLLYKDHANAKSNQQNLGVIKSSNLCVSPETVVLTSKGYFPIKELAETDNGAGRGVVEVWNGKVFSETTVTQTGVQQPLLTVSLDNGVEVRCTPYHKFYIETLGSNVSNIQVVEAKDLTVGMRLKRFDVPTINLPAPEEPLKYAYTQGLFAAEGTYQKYDADEKHRCPYQQSGDANVCKRHHNNVAKYDDDGELESGLAQCRAESYTDKPMMWLYGEKKALIDHVDWIYANANEGCDRLDVALHHDIKPKFFVPINYDIATKIRWLEGYTDGDGCVLENNGSKIVQVASTEKGFLIEVMYLLQTLGVKITIHKAQNAGVRSMPDGRGGRKDYMCNTTWRFNIDAKSIIHLVDLGYAPKRLKLGVLRLPHHVTNAFTKVSGIVDKGEVDDTFCFNEPLEHAGVFNGVLLGQCTEIVMYSSPEETAVCLAGDTTVITERRGAVRLDDVRPGDRVLTVFESDKDFSMRQRFATASLVDNGEKDVVRVFLSDGTDLVATADHRVLTHTFEGGYKWTAAGKLLPGLDRLVAPRARPLPGYAEVVGADGAEAKAASVFPVALREACATAVAGPPAAAAAFLRGALQAATWAEGRLELPPAPPVAELMRRFGVDEGYESLVALRDRVGLRSEALTQALRVSAPASDPDNPERGVRLVTVESVEPAGRQRVYDLSIPDGRHFVANGVIVHNCNLASLALPSYLTVDPASGGATGFDFVELARVAGIATRNLNKVIDVNFYPVEPARRSNHRHRPLGLGVQGLANVFAALRMPYDSPAAADLNRKIFATIYFGALDASCALAERLGPYETWAGCPASQGRLQYDMWNVAEPETVGGSLDWVALKARIAKHGLRNSLLVAPMPTASTSNILGFVESFEPYTSMAFTRRTLAGEFTIVCRELVEALIERGLWDKEMKETILRDDGSVQANLRVPEDLRAVFKTAWEIKQRDMIDMAADRGAYICQSASQNMFMADAGTELEKLFNAHLYSHAKGLKTACYYLRTKPKGKIQAFTLAPEGQSSAAAAASASAALAALALAPAEEGGVALACSRDNPNCESCSG